MTATNGRRMTFSIEVQAPPERVFALVSDIERHVDWSPHPFQAVRLDEGPIGPGSHYRTAGQRGVRKGAMRTTDVVVTEFEPPSRFGFAATEPAGTYHTTFDITPLGSGSRVERIIDPPTTGLVPFIRHRVLAPMVKNYVGNNMSAVKARLDEI